MKQSRYVVRAIAMALLSASLFAVGADAVELDGNSLSAIHADQNPAPASGITAVSENDSSVTLNNANAAGEYQVVYQSTKGSETSATVTPAKVGVDAYVRIKVDTSLNVRQGPGTYYSVLCNVENGTIFPLTGKTGKWYQVLCNGRTGYVSSDYAVVTNAEDVFTDPILNPDPQDATLAAQIVAYAKKYLGYPYVYATAGPNSFDCSGFTSYVFKHFGYTLHRSSKDQIKDGVAVSKSNLQPADILLFSNQNSGGAIGHVGIYIGDNQFIHASTPATGVIISDLTTDWYVQHYIAARRII